MAEPADGATTLKKKAVERLAAKSAPVVEEAPAEAVAQDAPVAEAAPVAVEAPVEAAVEETPQA